MSKTGVVISNLGTPNESTPKEVGKYLNDLLMDPHVIQSSYLMRFLLVKGVVVPFRKKKSAANYQKIWTPKGSPLLLETQKMVKALQNKLGEQYKVVIAMRYGSPSTEQAKKELQNCDKIIFFPQYPQYAASSYQTAVDCFYKYFGREDTAVVEPYFEYAPFTKAYVDFLKDELSDNKDDHLLMSFHGLPESHLEKTDPTGGHCLKSLDCCRKPSAEVLKTCYRAQCYRSAELIAEGLGMGQDDYSVSFQSRLGRQKWIDPSTESTFKTLLDCGVKNLTVICPGFAVDGLETLEEIAMAGEKTFLGLGGQSFNYTPCLNDDKRWIDACAQLVTET